MYENTSSSTARLAMVEPTHRSGKPTNQLQNTTDFFSLWRSRRKSKKSKFDNIHDAERGPLDCAFEIGVVQDECWALAAKFEGDFLEIARSCLLHNVSANESAFMFKMSLLTAKKNKNRMINSVHTASESNLADTHMSADSSTSNIAQPGNDVHHSRREPSFHDEFSDADGSERRPLRGLEYDSVAGGEGWPEFPGHHPNREVPGDDLANNTNSRAERVVAHRMIRRGKRIEPYRVFMGGEVKSDKQKSHAALYIFASKDEREEPR